jgi:mono/diheme cytochrome c family protein
MIRGAFEMENFMAIRLMIALFAMTAFGSLSCAADLQAGKAAADAKCSECHEADDWEGEDAAALESLIRDIVAGKVKHKRKLELTSADIANIAAYWGGAHR